MANSQAANIVKAAGLIFGWTTQIIMPNRSPYLLFIDTQVTIDLDL